MGFFDTFLFAVQVMQGNSRKGILQGFPNYIQTSFKLVPFNLRISIFPDIIGFTLEMDILEVKLPD